MTLPNARATRLQNFVATMILNGNSPLNLDLKTLARFNRWTSADELLVEFHIQQNGARRLPEELAVIALEIPKSEEIEE